MGLKFTLSGCSKIGVLSLLLVLGPGFALAQLCTDTTPKLGLTAEPQPFRFVSDQTEYYQTVLGDTPAFLICGQPIQLPKGEVLKIHEQSQGTFDGRNRVWGETLIDFDGPGKETSSRVFVPVDLLQKLAGKPDAETLNTSFAEKYTIDQLGVVRKKEKSPVLRYVAVLVVLALGAIWFIRRKGRKKPLPAKPAETVEPVDPYPPMPVWEQNTLNTHGSANWDAPYRIAAQTDGQRETGAAPAGSLYIGGGSLGNSLRTLMHAVTVAGSGQGKGVSVILPNLLSTPHCSWFVLDPKGENAKITARWQREKGQKVIILDPWDEQKRLGATHGVLPSGFNPLSFIKGNPDEMPESCGVIAEMIVPDQAHGDPFWPSRARALIKTYLLHLITAQPEREHHLGTLYRWLRLAQKERLTLWTAMQENLSCDELVKSGIGEFLGFGEDSKTLDSIFSTAQDSTTFLESVALRQSLEKNDFDPYELTNGKTTVYICLPERFLTTHGRWLRLVVGICLKACNYRPNRRINFLLDEFAVLGKMQDVQKAFAFARGQNISMWIFVQSLTQLIEIYGQHGANAFLANARLRQFFGVYDLDTQKYLSEYLGETTITALVRSQTSSQGGSSGTSSGSSTGGGGSTSSGTSAGANWSTSSTTNEQHMARRLLTSEEVGKSRSIITLIDGHKYIIPRLPYWDDIVNAHRDGRAVYYPIDRRDWEDFCDQVAGRKEKTTGINFAELNRADMPETKPGQQNKMIG